MGSPFGIFVGVGLSADDLATIQAAAIAAIVSGRRVSMNGLGRSGSYQFDLSPTQTMIEVKYALGVMGNTLPRRKITNVTVNQCNQGVL